VTLSHATLLSTLSWRTSVRDCATFEERTERGPKGSGVRRSRANSASATAKCRDRALQLRGVVACCLPSCGWRDAARGCVASQRWQALAAASHGRAPRARPAPRLSPVHARAALPPALGARRRAGKRHGGTLRREGQASGGKLLTLDSGPTDRPDGPRSHRSRGQGLLSFPE
jgi:hypothetical protein